MPAYAGILVFLIFKCNGKSLEKSGLGLSTATKKSLLSEISIGILIFSIG